MTYKKFFSIQAISFIIMYGVMFLNVAEFNHVYLSLTRLYMALLMVTPMSIIMMLFMGKMYPNPIMNKRIIAGSAISFVIVLFLLRNQVSIGDRSYMQAMIPHHSSAILTSRNAKIKDPEVRQLADGIIKAQEEEIAKMKTILKRLN